MLAAATIAANVSPTLSFVGTGNLRGRDAGVTFTNSQGNSHRRDIERAVVNLDIWLSENVG